MTMTAPETMPPPARLEAEISTLERAWGFRIHREHPLVQLARRTGSGFEYIFQQGNRSMPDFESECRILFGADTPSQITAREKAIAAAEAANEKVAALDAEAAERAQRWDTALTGFERLAAARDAVSIALADVRDYIVTNEALFADAVRTTGPIGRGTAGEFAANVIRHQSTIPLFEAEAAKVAVEVAAQGRNVRALAVEFAVPRNRLPAELQKLSG